jgi:hypothetical protein
MANKRRISCYVFSHAMQGHVLRFAAVHGPLGGGTGGFSMAAAEVALKQMLDRDLFLTDFGSEVKVEVICTIEHSLSLAAIAERLKREAAGEIHRVA